MEDAFFDTLNYFFQGVDPQRYDILRNELEMRDAINLLKHMSIDTPIGSTGSHLISLCDTVNSTLRNDRNRIIHDPIYRIHGYERYTNKTFIRKQPKPVRLETFAVARISPELVNALSEAIQDAEKYLGAITLCIDEFLYCGGESVEATVGLDIEARAFEATIASYIAMAKS